MENEDFELGFLYDQLIAYTKRCLNDYIKSKKGTLAELKDRFRRPLTEEERGRIKNVKQLLDALEEKAVVSVSNVKCLKILARSLGLEELVVKVEEFETESSGRIQRIRNAAAKAPAVIWETIKGGAQTSVIHLTTVLSVKEVQITIAGAILLGIYRMNPENLKKLEPFWDFGAKLVGVHRGSVIFVLKLSSTSSMKRLWQSYKDGSLKTKLKKALNEIKELKELSHGEEIDVDVTIDEDEYREVYWNLILSEVEANNLAKQDSTKREQRRHSMCCERDVPKDISNKLGVTQIQIRIGRHVTELDGVISHLNSVKAKLKQGTRRFEDGSEVSRTIEFQKEKLIEMRGELSEMKIILAASGFSAIKVEEAERDLKESTKPQGLQPLQLPRFAIPEPFLSGSSGMRESQRRKEKALEDRFGSVKRKRAEAASFRVRQDGTPDRRFIQSKFKVRDYQKEVEALALEGKNTIIYAPTNSDKIFVAMEITKRHLDACKLRTPKVIFVENKQKLVAQQEASFQEYLKNYNVSASFGNISKLRPLHRVMQDNDVVVLTADVLLNALRYKSVNISDITLLMFDECHHANKNHPYNQIMQVYLEMKFRKIEEERLPQVIGLNASLGVNQLQTAAKAKEHILHLCANLDACEIRTVRKNIEEFQTNVPNIFELEINKLMEEIERDSFIDPPQGKDRQDESYRQWIELLKRDASLMKKKKKLASASLLIRCHEALLINNRLRIEDAIGHLDDYLNTLVKSKLTETGSWPPEMFLKTKEKIEKHVQEAGSPENPLLKDLLEQLKGFHTKVGEESKPKGIIFTRTSDYAFALKKWMEETEELKEFLRPAVLLGSYKLTQNQQEQVLQMFEEGTVNIIIATTAAKEGMDLNNCDYVIHYGDVKGNEIHALKSSGRIREKEGTYVHLSGAKWKGAERERQKEDRTLLMELVLKDIQAIPKEIFGQQIESLQIKRMGVLKMKQEPVEALEKPQLEDGVTFSCKKCNAIVCDAQDIRRFRGSYHLVINHTIYQRIDVKPREKRKLYDGVNIDKKIHCKNCHHDWGALVTVEGREWPCLKVSNLVTMLSYGRERKLFKKWKDLPFEIREASLKEMHQKRMYPK